MMSRSYVCLHTQFIFILILCSLASSEIIDNAAEYKVVDKVIKQCSLAPNKYSCLANKAAVAMERAIPLDIPLFDGITFARNEENITDLTDSRSWNSGIDRLYSAVSRFLDSHSLTLDFTQQATSEARDGDGGGGGGGGGHGGGGGSGGKGSKKEKKHLRYALMVLLGVFGISGPLIMQTLGIIAGKALIASKIALLIVGSVALKKIFEKEPGHSSVKVHTHTVHDHQDDDYDRKISPGAFRFLNTL